MKNLKNKIMLFVSCFALLFALPAQTTGQETEAGNQNLAENRRLVEFGVRFMPTISSLKMQTSEGGTVSGEATLGFGVGALLGFHFNQFVGVQGEIIYSSVSRKYSELDVERKVNLAYVNIPILLSVNTGKYKAVNLNLVAGPQIGINVKNRVYSSGTDVSSKDEAILSVKKADLGLAYGAGLDFGLNKSRNIRLAMGFRGVLGLIDISDNSSTIVTDSYYIIDRTHLETYSGYIGFSFLF
jgi:hypothetical protein